MEQFGDDIITLVGSIRSDSAHSVPKTGRIAEESAISGIVQESTHHGDSAVISASQSTATGNSTANNLASQASMFRSDSGSAAAYDLPMKDNTAAGYWTWRLFSDGYSESEVMAIKRCDSGELVSQLLLAIESGLTVDPNWITDEHGTELLRKSNSGPAVGG